jgi:hypothetical protein
VKDSHRTPAQRNGDREWIDGHPPIHEQHPLSEREQRLVDESAARIRDRKTGHEV